MTTLDHTYPPTKCIWSPASLQAPLISSVSDIIRIWEISENSIPNLKSQLMINNSSELSAPLTSADWNKDDPSILGVSSIDTTCTIWDINAERAT